MWTCAHRSDARQFSKPKTSTGDYHELQSTPWRMLINAARSELKVKQVCLED